MAVRYYDDAIIQKLKRWIPENSSLRVLHPDESKRLFELVATDNNDKPLQLPFIALSRDNNIELLSTVKQLKSFNGAKLSGGAMTVDDLNTSKVLNAIPIKLNYQLDIYAKKAEDCDEYVRNFLFKLINNPVIMIDIPYNGTNIQHIANIRILNTISDTSAISERLFSGQFSRWTIQFEIQDAFLFSIPYKRNWKITDIGLSTTADLSLDVKYDEQEGNTDCCSIIKP